MHKTNLSESDRALIKSAILIMSKEQPSEEELSFLMNRCAPGAEIAKRMLKLELESIEFADPTKRDGTLALLESLMTVVAQLSLISGGIGLADFSRTTAMEADFKATG